MLCSDGRLQHIDGSDLQVSYPIFSVKMFEKGSFAYAVLAPLAIGLDLAGCDRLHAS